MSSETVAQKRRAPGGMQAVCVHQFGGVEAMVVEQIPEPVPGEGQVLVRVRAAGVGPWDAWVRAGKSVLPQPLPLVLGADLAGIVEEVGNGISSSRMGEEVFGVTNSRFTGAYAEYALAEFTMIAPKPERLNFVEAASVPVVACTAWQMVFDHGQVDREKRVLVHGAAGNVGAYAVQFAKRTGAEVIATAWAPDLDYVHSLHADQVLDAHKVRFEESIKEVDVVLDTVGGETLDRSFAVLKPGGILVSSAERPNEEKAVRHHVRALFFLVAVTTECLTRIGAMLDQGEITPRIGEALPLEEARLAHEMLAGKPHRSGKIVLAVDA